MLPGLKPISLKIVTGSEEGANTFKYAYAQKRKKRTKK